MWQDEMFLSEEIARHDSRAKEKWKAKEKMGNMNGLRRNEFQQ